jgi:hypothetical protein
MAVNPVRFGYSNNSDSQFDILVTPTVKGKSQATAEQNKYIFTEFAGPLSDFKIFDLVKRMPEDDVMVIEISTCIGDLEYRLTDKLNLYTHDYISIDHILNSDGGRYFIKIDLNKYKSSNFYLIMWAKEGPNMDCILKNDRYVCTEKTVSMLYYFTTTDNNYKTSFANNRGSIEVVSTFSNVVHIKWSKVLSLNSQSNLIKEAPANYYVYVTDSTFDYNHMQSICYLSKMKNDNIPIEYNIEEVEAKVTGLKPNNKYFVNILAKNTETNEIIAYKPIEIIPVSSFPIVIVGKIIHINH